MQCQWNKLKEPTLEHYKPMPIDQFDCFKKQKTDINVFGENISNLIR